MDPSDNDLSAAVQAGREAVTAGARCVELHGLPVVILPTDMRATIMAELLDEAEKRAPAPARRRGTSTHTELDSFCAHVNRFKDVDSIVFADVEKVQLTALLDYHRAGSDGTPRWGQHRSVYTCPLSKAWERWTASNEKPMSQDAFAQFVEDNMDNLESEEGFPSPAAVLEMARNLVIHQNARFERKINPTTGESALLAKDEHDATTSTKIHRAFLLKLPVFEAGTIYHIEARIRFRLEGGRPVFAYSLKNPDDVQRNAFAAVRKQAAETTGLPVWAGSPE